MRMLGPAQASVSAWLDGWMDAFCERQQERSSAALEVLIEARW
jgi:hypothetical protein